MSVPNGANRNFRDVDPFRVRVSCETVSVHTSTLAARIARMLLTLTGVCVLACGGEISVRNDGDSPARGAGNIASISGGPETEPPAPSTRAARLTHPQWENSVRDLFHLGDDTSFSKMLRSDPVQSGFLFDNNSTTLSVDDALWSGYQRAAEQIAEYVTTDASRLNPWLPAVTPGAAPGATAAPPPATATDPEARARGFVEGFGLRAHRRPLTAQERDEYLALFRMGSAMYPGMGGFEAGARLVVEAMLQSPHFLYRLEQSADERAGKIPLTSYEVASRLSFALWNTMPDAALLESAQANRLIESGEVAAQAQRMLADPRAQEVVGHFHDQLFQVGRFESIKPAPGVFPDLPTNFGAEVATEQRRFVRETLFAGQGGFEALITSTDTYVNADLGKLYGIANASSFGSDFRKVTLDASQRRGIFTQLGFLALNATSVNPDPIHRGVFLARRFTCATISAPPAMVPPLPEPMGRTNRETVEAHTQMPGTICASCHASIINPLGFPFESYDAIGRYRTMDNNHPVVTSSDPTIGGQQVHVDNALDLAEALADSAQAHQCYMQHWLEFAYGRAQLPDDAGMIAKLAKLSHEDHQPVLRLITALVTSPAFLNRSTKELP